MSNKPQQVLEAIERQLAVISKANGYHTDIGTKIILRDTQRGETQRPSIAIGTRSGTIDRTNETGEMGGRVSPKARRMDLVIEAGIAARGDTAQEMGLLMLEDIERAWNVRSCGAPDGVSKIQISTWQILDRPEGIDAAVLQFIGFAEYIRDA